MGPETVQHKPFTMNNNKNADYRFLFINEILTLVVKININVFNFMQKILQQICVFKKSVLYFRLVFTLSQQIWKFSLS